MKIFTSIIVLVGALFLGLCFYLYTQQSSLVLLPEKGDTVAPPGVEEHKVRAADGTELELWFADTPGSDKVILYFHGNGGNLNYSISRIGLSRSLGLAHCMLDYRGYGESQGGASSEDDLFLDARAALDFLQSKGYSESDVYFWGRSLGGALAVELATEARPAGLILESTFASIEEFAKESYPWAPIEYLLRFKLRSDKRIDQVACPILMFHSETDETVPIESAQRLFERAPEPKTFVKIKGGHSGDYTVSEDVIRGALKEVFGW